MEIKVERIDVSKNYSRQKIYTPVDITSEVVMPIIDVERLDTTLDTSSIVLINHNKNAIKPFTRFKITLTSGENTQTIYRLVDTDNPVKLTYTLNPKYRHEVSLIEPTKWLERFDVDNTTITNFLAFLYNQDDAPIVIESAFTPYNLRMDGTAYNKAYLGTSYSNDTRIYDTFSQYSQQPVNIRMSPLFQYTYWLLFIPIGTAKVVANLTNYTITDPDGIVIDAINLTNYTFNKLGTYTFNQRYCIAANPPVPTTGFLNAEISYSWQTKVIAISQTQEKYTQRYTIKQVCDLVLGKVGEETTILRNGLDSPLFHLDPDITEKLDSITSPEFTFTQNTLFGILNQIGSQIHAIPRLKPFIFEEYTTDENNETITNTNDYSLWNVISFDFLGGSTAAVNGEVTAIEETIKGDNYASSFVSNIQNSFQTNNADYISLTEPYNNGFISTRTNDGNYEISDNSAIIKTSRPIQRIVELLVWYDENQPVLDISEFVKESTDYSILKDYAATDIEFTGYSTKSTAIYYTRGENTIQGLDYIQPAEFVTQVVNLTQAIKNIIMLKTSAASPPSVKLKDLMFKIKYVPFYNLKAKQYKALIDDNSGGNELYYNQNQTQSVDIESLGENIKGALLRTANTEPTETAYFSDFTNIIHVGEVTDENYYAYQVNKEITNRRIKATTKFSKDWNKLNEYVGIKKNYREWEISERESIESNPCENEFVIISNELDTEKDVSITPEQLQLYKDTLAEYGGFLSDSAIQQVFYRIANTENVTLKSIEWVAATATSKEYSGAGEYVDVSNSFILPSTCVSFGNSIMLNFGAQDNYAAGTYARNYDNNYAIENFVKYCDKYGKIENMALCFGSGSAKTNGFNSYANALTSSKEFYSFNMANLDTTAVLIDYRSHTFILNKDSRQKLNMTLQLHFVTDNSNIWIGKALAQAMPFVGNTENNIFKFVTFSQKPDKFLTTIDTSIFTEDTMPICTPDYDLKYIKLESKTINTNCVGYGIVDNQNRVVLYYDKEVSSGGTTDPIYFQFRRRI